MDKIRLVFFGCMVSCAVFAHAGSHSRKCTPHDATEADGIVDQLHSWKMVEAAVRRYGHCDSGSIAEGNSEAVARLLVDQWDTLPTLVRLGAANPGLQRFVVLHVDSTLDTSDLKRIVQLSADSCPHDAASLCKQLRAAATAALGENTR